MDSKVTAKHDAIRSAIRLLERATLDEPASYWQDAIDMLAPYWEEQWVTDVNLAVGFLQALRDRTPDEARTREQREGMIDEAKTFLWEALRATGGLTEAEQMEDLIAGDEAARLFPGDEDEGGPLRALPWPD